MERNTKPGIDINRARLETLKVLGQAEALASRRGAKNAALYLSETAERLMDKWWPDRSRILRGVWHNDPSFLEP